MRLDSSVNESSFSSVDQRSFLSEMLRQYLSDRVHLRAIIMIALGTGVAAFLIIQMVSAGMFVTRYVFDLHKVPQVSFIDSVRQNIPNPWHPIKQAFNRLSLKFHPGPVILFWTQFFSEAFDERSDLFQEAQKELDDCPAARKCALTMDRELLSASSAVMFHFRDMTPENPLPKFRHPQQYFTFFLLESPQHTEFGNTRNLSSLPEYFNLTFTYRLDSDITSLAYFKYYHPTLWTAENEFDKLWKSKIKFAASFMSYCQGPSGRYEYLVEITKLISVDIYGTCGSLTCPKTDKGRCEEKLAEYKFYLAFENSICHDYVTEKIHRAFNHGVIPVVYGGANYTAIFPPNSFINVLNFPDPKSLVDHLKKVADHVELYRSYFAWRHLPEWTHLPQTLLPQNNSWCKLCQLLNSDTPIEKSYPNIETWWMNGQCASPALKKDGELKVWKGPPRKEDMQW